MAKKYGPFLLLLAVVCGLLSFPVHSRRGDAMLLRLEDPSWECYQNFELKEADCLSRELDSVPQSLSEDTERLILSHNYIALLTNSSFKKYPLITYLDLSSNDIRMIDPTAFYPLKDLEYLDISYNPHIVLPDTDLLRWASKLSTLHVAFSNLKWLPNDTLKWSSHLDSISFAYNRLSSINITSCGATRETILSYNQFEHLNADSFNFACHAETLSLYGNPIKSVDPSVIASLHVRSLRLGRSSLTLEVLRNIFIGISGSTIEELKIFDADLNLSLIDFFDPLRDHFLSVLDLSSNEIGGLYRDVFSNLTKVHQLYLDYNRIAIIEPEFFEGMRELRVLNLISNGLKYINPNNHTWSVDLVELRLANNLLTAISKFTFLGLGNLTLLDLSSNNGLVVFEVTSLTGLDNLRTIDLSHCDIERLQLDTPALKSLSLHHVRRPRTRGITLEPGETFKGTKLLLHLDMKEVGIFDRNLWDATLNVSLFDGLFHLKTLKMSENAIYQIDENNRIFRQLHALQELYLDKCLLYIVHPNSFATLESLQKLSLRDNMLNQLHPDLLKGLGQLISIDLSGNEITHLDETIFLNNKMLSNILLADNKLTSLNQKTFIPVMSSLTSLDLALNQLSCQCDIKWLIAWLRGPVHLEDAHNTICSCASMPPLRGKPLLDFDINVLCRSNNLPASLIPFAVICSVVVFVLVYHTRSGWLKYKLFLLKLAICGYEEIQDARDHNDYEFDLNIIFYDDDEEWVREHLRPTIGDQLPQFQRNIFGDQDLVLGMHYLDSVDYVVSHSYKTLILLSRAAVRDRWFMLKLRIAMDHVSDTQTEFVVAVFLEDIPDDEIPFLARLYLSDGRPYLYWPEDVRGQEYFWYELVKQLTINLRTNDLIPNE